MCEGVLSGLCGVWIRVHARNAQVLPGRLFDIEAEAAAAAATPDPVQHCRSFAVLELYTACMG